tara:strand:- start:638 stop:1363 length:726 start_codon:yes stop_codon:yes gene_type:complete
MLDRILKILIKKTINQESAMKHQILNTIINEPIKENQEEILFGCGCFWGAEKGFWKLPGVISTAVGYAGGQEKDPTYQNVCSGKTGHSEVVRVVWDQSIIDLSDLLKLFWECHDPTQGDRQGNDNGSQYRSVIYTYKINHLNKAKASLRSYQYKLSKEGYGQITTEINNNVYFYFAEEYHQQYLARKGSRPYCSAMPTKVKFDNFEGSNFKMNESIWEQYDWNISHCILRSNNEPLNMEKI